MASDDTLAKLAAEFNRYFTSANSVDVGERVSVPAAEWRALFAALTAQAPAAPDGRGTDAQIEKERDIARHAIVGALAAGHAGQVHPGPDHWLAAAHDAGVKIRALEVSAQQAPAAAELDEADRRAGAAERQLASLRETNEAHDQARRKMKAEAGYHNNVSFDIVWRETLAKAQQAPLTEDSQDAKRWRFLGDRWQVSFTDGKFTHLNSVVSEGWCSSLNACIDRMIAGDWSDVGAAQQAAQAPAGWQPIETAPDDTTEPVVVGWTNSDGEEERCFDYKEDGCWMEWHSHAEHVEIIGGHGVSYTPPYTHWMKIHTMRAARPQAEGSTTC